MNRWLAYELAAHKDPSLIGFWPLLGSLRDYSGNAHHGLLRDGTGNAPDVEQTSSNMCGRVGFNAGYTTFESPYDEVTARFVECKDTDLLEDFAFTPSSKFSLSIWYCKNIQIGTLASLFSKSVGTLDLSGFYGWIFTEGVNDFRFQFRSPDGFTFKGLTINAEYEFDLPELVYGNADIGLNSFGRWNHIVFVYDGEVVDDEFISNGTAFYLNGHRVGFAATVNEDLPLEDGYNYGKLRIGCNEDTDLGFSTTSPVYPCVGDTLRLARIYNRGLSANEVTNLYKRERFVEEFRYKPKNVFIHLAGLTCYITGSDTTTNEATLFIKGSTGTGVTSSTTLHIHGQELTNSNTTLFVRGYSGNPERDAPTSQLGIYRSSLGNFLLGFDGEESPINRRTTLYIRGISTNGNFDGGYDPEFPLFEQGHEEVSLWSTLFIGETPHKGMNLFMKGEDPFTALAAATAYVRGTNADNEMAAGTTLYIFSDVDGNQQEKSMNLYLAGPDSSTDGKGMNLVITGENQRASGSCELFLMNTQTMETAETTLYIRGEGTTDGAFSANSGMNLFLKRDPANAITCFIAGPGEPLDESMTLHIIGAGTQTFGANLSIPNVLGYSTSTVRLYTNGF